MQMNAVAAAARAAQDGSAPQPRLVRAAHEFEAQMMKELMKPMTSGDALIGRDDVSGTDSGGVLGEFASESLGRAVSEKGGLGIANSILNSLSPPRNSTRSVDVLENLAKFALKTHK